MTQQGDVVLCQTDDGGDIEAIGGLITMSGGLETAAYLSMFGGNEDDPGGSDTALSWWGNLSEAQPEHQYRSETQYILRSLPATSNNLRRLEDAAGRDLAWFVTVGAATEVTVSAIIPALNRVRITIEGLGEPGLVFDENWRSAL